MVQFEEDTSNQRCICKSDKLVTDIIIEKSIGGFKFFEIKVTKGSVPQALTGKFTSIRAAKKAVEDYLRKKEDTPAARREYFAKAREERNKENATKSKAKGSKHVHQGSGN